MLRDKQSWGTTIRDQSEQLHRRRKLIWIYVDVPQSGPGSGRVFWPGCELEWLRHTTDRGDVRFEGPCRMVPKLG